MVAAYLLLRTPDTDPGAMRAKYGNEASRYLSLPDGQTIHYRDEGNPQGPAMLLVHGGGASLHTWQSLIDRLGGDYRIITLDLPGHGLSGMPEGQSFRYDEAVAAVEAVRHKLGLNAFILGGNSLGGSVGWRYTLAHPDRIRALLLLDAGGMPLRAGEPLPESNFAFRMMRTSAGRWAVQRITPRSMVERSLRESVIRQDFISPSMVDRYWELGRYPGNRRALTDIFAMPFVTADNADKVRAIKAPTLILFGKDDPVIRASAAQTFHENISGSEVVLLDGVGHLPMEEDADRTAQAIRAFLVRRLPQ